MNKPSDPTTFRSNVPLYRDDPYGWAMYQAGLIRERHADLLDWDNIAEEIETMGRSERRSLQSHLAQLIMHMMKWDAQPERRGRSWFISIRNHRRAALRDLADNPSLKAELAVLIRQATQDARDEAEDETGLPNTIFDALSYDIETIFEREHLLSDDS